MSSPRVPARAVGAALLVLGLPGVLFGWHATRYGRWFVDDAMISFSYARTLATDGRLAQQPSAPLAEGFSNLTWTVLLALLHWLRLFDAGHVVFGIEDYVLAPKFLGGLLFLATTALTWVGARTFLPAGWAGLAATIAGSALALFPPYVVWAVGGLENPLYGFLAAALWAVLVRSLRAGTLGSLPVALSTAGIALLAAATRPDGVVYAAGYPVAVLLAGGRGFWRRAGWAGVSAAAFGTCYGLLLLLRHAVFGLWVPNTAVAKDQQVPSLASVPRALDLVQVTRPLLIANAVLLLVLAAVPVVRRRHQAPGGHALGRSFWWPVAFLGVLGLLAVGAYVVLNADWMAMYRFATPAWVTAAALLGCCAAALGRAVGSRWAGPAVALGVAALLTGAWLGWQPSARAFSAHPSAPACYVVDRYGRQYNFYADALGVETGTVLAHDIGGMLMTSRLQVIDQAGLTDETVAGFKAARNYAGLRDWVFTDLRPTFLNLHPGWDNGILEDPRLRRDYVSLLGSTDWVRRSAIPVGYELGPLRTAALQFAVRAENWRQTAPLTSCGPLVVGQEPAQVER